MREPAPCGSFARCICTTGNFKPGGPAADSCHEKIGWGGVCLTGDVRRSSRFCSGESL